MPLICILISASDYKEQESFKTLRVVVGEESYLTILGKTNINKFSCSYYGELSQDTLQIQIAQLSEGVKIDDVQLQLNIDQFDCGNKAMNKDFQDLLNHAEYPSISIDLLKVLPPNSVNKDYNPNVFGLARAKFHISGYSSSYLIPIYKKKQNQDTFFVGQHHLDITDFNLTPPTKFLGMIKVEEDVTIEFGLNITIFSI